MQTRGSCHWLVGTQGNWRSREGPWDPGILGSKDRGILGSADPPVYISRVVSQRVEGYAQLNTVLYTY
jgi:hypothetical protein